MNELLCIHVGIMSNLNWSSMDIYIYIINMENKARLWALHSDEVFQAWGVLEIHETHNLAMATWSSTQRFMGYKGHSLKIIWRRCGMSGFGQKLGSICGSCVIVINTEWGKFQGVSCVDGPSLQKQKDRWDYENCLEGVDMVNILTLLWVSPSCRLEGQALSSRKPLQPIGRPAIGWRLLWSLGCLMLSYLSHTDTQTCM